MVVDRGGEPSTAPLACALRDAPHLVHLADIKGPTVAARREIGLARCTLVFPAVVQP